MSNESFNDYVLFDLETLNQVHGSDFYNISYVPPSPEVVREAGELNALDNDYAVVGDKFYDALAGEIEVIFVSEFGQIVAKFSDGSISLFESVEDIEDDGFVKIMETDGWINVIRDTDFNDIFFDEGVYVTKDDAVNAFEDTRLSSWELLDTTYISWSNIKND
jgi:hypothetical protein